VYPLRKCHDPGSQYERQPLGLTARLDIGKGMATQLCAVWWARLMT
jgi:hypothetical protein